MTGGMEFFSCSWGVKGRAEYVPIRSLRNTPVKDRLTRLFPLVTGDIETYREDDGVGRGERLIVSNN
jgi:hypothetical protein